MSFSERPLIEKFDEFGMYNKLHDKIMDMGNQEGIKIDLLTSGPEVAGNEAVAILHEQIRGRDASDKNTLIQGGFGSTQDTLFKQSTWQLPTRVFMLKGKDNFGSAVINRGSVVENNSFISGYIYAHGQLDNSKLIGDSFFYNNITGNYFTTGPIQNAKITDSTIRGNIGIHGATLEGATINARSNNNFRSVVSGSSSVVFSGTFNEFGQVYHSYSGSIRNERTQYNSEPIALDPEEYKYTDGDGNYNATNPPPEDTEVSPPLGDVLY